MNNMENTENNNAYKNLLDSMVSDMKFIGTFSIIYGIIQCLGIISAIIGIPLIITGLRLRESADFYSSYIHSDNETDLKYAQERLSKFFNIHKLLIIFAIIISALTLVGMGLIFSFMGMKIFEQI